MRVLAPFHRLGLLFIALLLCEGRSAPARAEVAGIPLGPVRIFPSLSLTAIHDDNVALASDETTSDWITIIAPGLRLELPVRRLLLEAEGGLESRTYADVKDENANDWFVRAAAGARFPGGLEFEVSERYAERYLPSSQEYGPGERSSLESLAGSVGYAVREAWRLELRARRDEYGFDRSFDRGRSENTVQADCSWRFRPRTSVFFEGAVTEYAYHEETAQDNAASTLAIGATWEATSRTAASAKVGRQWKRYQDELPALGSEDNEYVVVTAGARHSFTRRTAVEVELSRGAHESDFLENPYYLRTAVSAGLSQRFTTKLSGRAALSYAGDDYPHDTTYRNPYDPARGAESGRRRDTTLGARAAVGFEATRWLTLEAAWSSERRTSNFQTFEYAHGQISFSARAAF